MNMNSNTRRNVPAFAVPKLEKYIEIVGSSLPRLNAMAEDSQLSIQSVLKRHYTHVGITIVDDMAGLERLVAKKPDLVVLGMKLVLLDSGKSYDDSRKVWLSSYLKQHGIQVTGSDTAALQLEFDKHTAKQRVLDAGLQSSAYFISSIVQPVFAHSLTFPLFVKPTNRGDSKGVDERSVVHNDAELKAKIRSIHTELSSDALVEEYLPGREFSVAVIERSGGRVELAMPVEITTPPDVYGNSFLSEAVKQADSEKVLPVNDAGLKHALNTLAIGVFRALGSRDYGRIDMRLNGNGVPSFIEANLMPGLSTHGYLARCFDLNEQTNYEDMVLSLVSPGLQRTERKLVGTVFGRLHRDAPNSVLKPSRLGGKLPV